MLSLHGRELLSHPVIILYTEGFSWLVWKDGWFGRRLNVRIWNLIWLVISLCRCNWYVVCLYNCFCIISVRFRFVLSPQPTPATLYLMKRCQWAATEELAKLDQIEVCPKSMELTQTIAKRISSDGGGALIIDYGLNAVISDSLQVC